MTGGLIYPAVTKSQRTPFTALYSNSIPHVQLHCCPYYSVYNSANPHTGMGECGQGKNEELGTKVAGVAVSRKWSLAVEANG